MASAEFIRKRFLYLQEKKIFNWRVSIGGQWIENVVRFDASNPNYMKVETVLQSFTKNSPVNREASLACIVFNYSGVETIVTPLHDAKGVTQYAQALDPEISAIAVATVEDRALTNRKILQKINLLSEDLRKKFYIYVGGNVVEEYLDYSTADADTIVGVVPWVQISFPQSSLVKHQTAYGAIDAIVLQWPIYGPGSNNEAGKPENFSIKLPWE